MVDFVIVTHGTLAPSLLESAQMLVGDQEGVDTLTLSLGESIDEFRDQVAKTLDVAAERGNEVMVISDMLAGSPFNCVCAASEKHSFEHLTGVNFPLLLEMLSLRADSSAHQLVELAIEQAPETVLDARKYFEEVM